MPVYLKKNKWLFLLPALLMSGIILFLSQVASYSSKLASKSPLAIQGKNGPWGFLEYVPIIITPSLEFIDPAIYDNQDGFWYFPQISQPQLVLLLQSADLNKEQQEHLLSAKLPCPEIRGFKFAPDIQFVQSLSNSSRLRLYTYLGQFTINPGHKDAYRFCGTSVQEWLDQQDSGLSDELIGLVEKLSFHNGTFLFFADYSLLKPFLPDPVLKARFIHRLYAQSTFLVRLRIGPVSDIESIINYWGQGGRENEIGPVLRSLEDLNSSNTIDIIQLLPQFARLRLNTYPSVSSDSLAKSRDCHWTSLNFFNDDPDENFTDINFVINAVTSEYEKISGKPILGDLILYTDTANTVFHSAVYIADNIVFTKNGPEQKWPWMFMRLEDMEHFYLLGGPVKIEYYRKKESRS